MKKPKGSKTYLEIIILVPIDPTNPKLISTIQLNKQPEYSKLSVMRCYWTNMAQMVGAIATHRRGRRLNN